MTYLSNMKYLDNIFPIEREAMVTGIIARREHMVNKNPAVVIKRQVEIDEAREYAHENQH